MLLLIPSCRETSSDQTADNARSHRILSILFCTEDKDMHNPDSRLPASGQYKYGFLVFYEPMSPLHVSEFRVSGLPVLDQRSVSFQHSIYQSSAHQHLPPFDSLLAHTITHFALFCILVKPLSVTEVLFPYVLLIFANGTPLNRVDMTQSRANSLTGFANLSNVTLFHID